MPITFACECGKPFSVADEYAGKRTKCPACGSALTVPLSTTESDELSEEDRAFRALAEAPDADPVPRPVARSYEAAPRTPPAPQAPIPGAVSAKRGPKVERREREREGRSRTSGIHLTPAVWGGLFAMLGAVVWFVLGLAGGVIFFYPPILFLFGLVAVVRGLLGYSED